MTPTARPDAPAPPLPVRAAAVVVTLQGLLALAVGLVLLVTEGIASFGVWGFVVLLGALVTGVGIALWTGRRGARGPALMAQLLLLGVAFYAAVPSARPEWGVPAAVVAVVVLVLMLGRAGREWMGDPGDDDR